MASFTDSLQSFTPYVEQFPVQAALQVGMQKQQQYNQGIERIQNQIDNIAGLDIVRDVDKQYLQSRLNDLGGNLKKVAAGDFSNFQLVNSVGGMINKIGKDSNIQNAVSSTIKYKRGLTDMETAKKEGKSSPSNEWDFMTQASRWLSSPDVKESFNSGYTPYTNYKKNALDAIKSLTKDESITDDAFTLDSRGNLVIADATVRKKLAGISPDKIQQALMATLSPADFRQMEIDGRYTYANADPKKLAASINNSYVEKLDFFNKQKTILESAKSSTTSNIEKNALNDKIASLDKVISNITAESRGMRDMIASGNIEAVKAQLHTANFLDNFSKAFSFTETSNTYTSSPLAEMAMQRANKEQDWKKFILGMEWDKTKFALTFEQKNKEIGLKKKETEGYGGLPMGVSQADLPKYTISKFIADTETQANQIEQADSTFLKQQGKDQNWLIMQKEAWQKTPTSVDPKVANHFNTTEEMRRQVESNKAAVSDINKQAKERFGDINDLIPNDDDLFIYQSPEGITAIYSAADFVSANENKNKYIKSLGSGGTGGRGAIAYDLEKAKRELPYKEYNLLRVQSGRNLNEADEALLERAQHYNKLVNLPYQETIKKINDFTADEITKRITVSQGVSYGIPTGNEVEKSSINTVLSQFIDLAGSQKDALANSPNFDIDAARKVATSNDITYSMTVVEGTQYQSPMYKINVSGKLGNEVVSTEFNLTPEQKNAVFGQTFEATPEVQAFRPYQEQIRKMGGYSTALSPGTSNHNNAYLGKVDFPSIKVYGVKANIEQPSPGNYSIRISAFDPMKKQWFEDISYPRESLVREDQVIPLMRMLNDAAVFELLNDVAPTAEDLKRMKEASKKPL